MSLGRAGLLVTATLFLAAVVIAQRLAPPMSQSQCRTWLEAAESGRFQHATTKATPAGTPTTLTTMGLAVTASNEDLPRVQRFLTIRLPASDEYVEALLRFPPAALVDGASIPHPPADRPSRSDNIQQYLLQALLDANRGPLESSVASQLLSGVQDLPIIAVDGGFATLTLPLPDTTIGGDVLYPQTPPTPVFESIGEPWEAGRVHSDLAFRAAGALVPTTTRWNLDVCMEGLRIVADSPRPAYSDGAGRHSWEFLPGTTFDDVSLEVRTDPNPATRLRLWLFSASRRYIAYAWNFLVPMLPTLWALGFVLARGGAPESLGWRGERRSLIVALVSLIGFGTAAVIAVSARPLNVPDWAEQRQVLAAVAFAAPLTAAVWLWSRESPAVWHPLLAVAVVANLVVGVALCALPGHPLEERVPGWIADQMTTWVGLIPVWVVGNVLFGGALMAVMLLPPEAFGWIPSSWRGAFWWSSLLLAAIAILAQWAWAAYHRDFNPWRRAMNATLDTWGDFYDRLVELRYFQEFPVRFLAPTVDLMPLLALTAMFGALAAVAGSPHIRFLGGTGTWVNRSLIVLFAAFVIGLDGEVLGYRLPLAFLFGLALARFALHGEVARIVEEISTRDPGAGQRLFLKIGRQELLQRAIPLEDRGTPETLETPPPIWLSLGLDPKKLALPLGPTDAWWTSGALAARWGALFALIPISYYVYVLGTTEIEDAISGETVFGGATVVVALLSDIAFWLVAAFALGALFPYLRGSNGPTKALTLALVYGAARGLAALVLNDVDGAWIVRFFQLVLFLVILGVCLDLLTLRASQVDWHHLRTLYDLENTRSMVGFLAPLIINIAVVVENLVSGQAREAIVKIVSQLSTAIPMF